MMVFRDIHPLFINHHGCTPMPTPFKVFVSVVLPVPPHLTGWQLIVGVCQASFLQQWGRRRKRQRWVENRYGKNAALLSSLSFRERRLRVQEGCCSGGGENSPDEGWEPRAGPLSHSLLIANTCMYTHLLFWPLSSSTPGTQSRSKEYDYSGDVRAPARTLCSWSYVYVLRAHGHSQCVETPSFILLLLLLLLLLLPTTPTTTTTTTSRSRPVKTKQISGCVY